MSFIIVRYGSNEERLCNPNCLSVVLLNHIKKSCGFESLSENIDLATESGEVLDLLSKPKEYAKKFVEARGNYILVKIVGDDVDESSPNYVSLLDSATGVKFSSISLFLKKSLIGVVANPSNRNRVKAKQVKSETAPKPDETRLKPKPIKTDLTVKTEDPKSAKSPNTANTLASATASTEELKKAGTASSASSKPKKV